MLRSLISIQLRAMFSKGFLFRRGGGKKRRNKLLSRLLFILLAVYMVAAIGFSLGITFHNLHTAFSPMSLIWLYYVFAGTMAFTMSFIGSVYMAQQNLFSTRDNDLLLAMPIRPGYILLARSVALYLITLGIQVTVLLPALVVHLIAGGAGFSHVLLWLITSLLLPLPVMAMSILLGWLLTVISSRLHRKNLVVMVLSVAALIAYFVGYSRVVSVMEELVAKGRQIAQAVQEAFPPAYHYGLALAEGNLLSVLLFALFCMIPFALVMVWVAVNYHRVLSTRRGDPRIAYRGGGLKANSLMQALVTKEVRRFFGSPMYMLNTGISLLMMLGLPIYLAVDNTLKSTLQQTLGDITPYMGPAAVGLLSMMAGSVFISSVSISLEGKALWIVQSLPVLPIQALLAKASAHILISLPVVVLAGVIFGVTFRLDAFMFVMCLLLPLLLLVFNAFLGLLLNLRFPKLNWHNETEPVKQSMSPFLAMTLGFLLTLTLAGLGVYAASHGVDIPLYILLCAALLALGSYLLYLLLKAQADRAFLDLSEA